MEEDLITLNAKRIAFYFYFSIVTGLFSVVAYFLFHLYDSEAITAQSRYAILFLPVIFGTLGPCLVILHILRSICKKGLTLITVDERRSLQQSGIQSFEDYIEYESLPLMRKLYLCSTIVLCFLGSAFLSACMLYVYNVIGYFDLTTTLIPISVVWVLMVLFLVFVRVISLVHVMVTAILPIEVVILYFLCLQRFYFFNLLFCGLYSTYSIHLELRIGESLCFY